MSINPMPDANFTPTMQGYTNQTPFRFWCQKVLPLVYDDSLSYYELLCKVVDYLNNTIKDTAAMESNVTGLYTAYQQLQSYVNTYFSSLDVQAEIDNKLDVMTTDGTFFNLFYQEIASISFPRVVNTTSEMTNQKYTYVLASNGHVYQYSNGWVDTGLVYATNIANYIGIQSQKAVDLNTITLPGVYFHGTSDEVATNTPNDTVYGRAAFMLVSFYAGQYTNYQIFEEYTTNKIYIRHQKGSVFTAWEYLLTSTDELKLMRPISVTDVNSTDLNNLTTLGFFYHGTSDVAITNTPNDSTYSKQAFMVMSLYSTGTRNFQLFIGYNGVMYFRYKAANWTAWREVLTDPANYFKFSTMGTGTTNLNDLNSFEVKYHSTTHTAATNTPNDTIFARSNFYVTTYPITGNIILQMFYATNASQLYIRHKNNTWTNWIKIYNTNDSLFGLSTMTNTDLDTITESGYLYHSSSMDPAINTPDDEIFQNVGFMLLNYYDNSSRHYQLFFEYENNRVYSRHQKGSTWTKWVLLGGETVTARLTQAGNWQISFGKYTTRLQRTVNANTHTNLWNLNGINKGATQVVTPETDIIGPVKINNETDFIGGVHGYEVTNELTLIADGRKITETASCYDLHIIMQSTLYSRTSDAAVFSRKVDIQINIDKITVTTQYKALQNVLVNRASNGGLMAITNNMLTAVYTNNYFSAVPPTQAVNNSSKYNTVATLFWSGGSITVENIIGHEQNTYRGFLAVFTNETPIRTKSYMDVIASDTELSINDTINGRCTYTFL